MKELRCKRCGAPIRAEDVLEELAVAKCRTCQAVMELALPKATGDAPPRQERREVPIPSRFRLDRRKESLVIEWRWFTASTLFMLLFCCLWDGFLVLGFSTGLGSKELGAPGGRLFAATFVVAGMFLTWTTLASFLNSTRITVEQGVLRIRHFPIPWSGNRELRVRALDQLFAREVERDDEGTKTYTYDLVAIHKSGKELKLITRLETSAQALFLERQIEDHLGIVDRPVAGELPKSA